MLSTSLLSTTFPGAGVVPYPGPAATLPLNQHYVNAHSQHYSQPGYATSSATDAGLAPHALMSQAVCSHFGLGQTMHLPQVMLVFG